MNESRIRLGRFDKWGYKNSFSKGELARELVYTNEDKDNLKQEIERLNKENEELKKIQCTFLGTGCKAEMERLNNSLQQRDNIIKEVRELLESKKHCERLFGGVEGKTFTERALEILDKADKDHK